MTDCYCEGGRRMSAELRAGYGLSWIWSAGSKLTCRNASPCRAWNLCNAICSACLNRWQWDEKKCNPCGKKHTSWHIQLVILKLPACSQCIIKHAAHRDAGWDSLVLKFNGSFYTMFIENSIYSLNFLVYSLQLNTNHMVVSQEK